MTDGVPKAPDGRPLWYGRRRTHKLRPGREQLVETLLPKLAIDPAETAPLTRDGLFGPDYESLRLEIGFGAGEHLSGDAANNPRCAYIGCEPFINGVASLLADIDHQGLGNVRIFADDARLLLPRLADASVGRIYILFPDPWPKARHNRRRFIQAETLTDLARIAEDGGELIFASDHMGYVAWVLSAVRRHEDWRWTVQGPDDWRIPPGDWVPTRYEAKARRRGLRPAYLRFQRRPRG